MEKFQYSPLMADVRHWFLELKESERTERLLEWGEEQPHLYGFIINLADDFTTEEHHALSYLPLVLEEAFRRMGLPVISVPSDKLEEAIKSFVDEDGKLIERDNEGSVRMPDELRAIWEHLSDQPAGSMADRQDVTLITEILVTAYEKIVPDKLQ